MTSRDRSAANFDAMSKFLRKLTFPRLYRIISSLSAPISVDIVYRGVINLSWLPCVRARAVLRRVTRRLYLAVFASRLSWRGSMNILIITMVIVLVEGTVPRTKVIILAAT